MITNLSRDYTASAPYTSVTQKNWENQTLPIKAGIFFSPVQGQQQTAGWVPEKEGSSLLKLLLISAWVIPGIAESWVPECFGTHKKSKADVSLTPPSIWIIYIVQYPIWLPSVSHSSCCCCSLRQAFSTNDTALNQSLLLKGSVPASASLWWTVLRWIWESEQSAAFRLLKWNLFLLLPQNLCRICY